MEALKFLEARNPRNRENPRNPKQGRGRANFIENSHRLVLGGFACFDLTCFALRRSRSRKQRPQAWVAVAVAVWYFPI